MITTNVWLLYKKNEPRVYTRTTQPSDDLMKSYREAGFQVFRAEVKLPVTDDVDAVVHGQAEEVLP